jgi:hypothetical protein
VGQVLKLQAQRRVSTLSGNEAELLLKINRGIPADLQARCNELIAKRQAETLTPGEHEELIRLTAFAAGINEGFGNIGNSTSNPTNRAEYGLIKNL